MPKSTDPLTLSPFSHLFPQRQCETYSVSYEEVAKGEHSIEWPPMKKEVDLEARVDRENRKKPSATPIKTESAETGTSLNTHNNDDTLLIINHLLFFVAFIRGLVSRESSSSSVFKHSTWSLGEELPIGWATAKDSNGRVYYWHKETKATQWDRPTS